jgi:RNA polymerase sigma factor (TIGR02999 family)
MHEVTRILSAVEQGDAKAAEQLLPLVYEELRKLAAQKLAQEKPGQTLQATALVHEAYLRLVDVDKVQHWNSRGHFFAAAAEAIRRILIDRAREKQGPRRGTGQRRELREDDLMSLPATADILDLDQAISRFAELDPQAVDVVKMRVFAGMTVQEIAEATGISARTVKRNWAYARAWLSRELADYASPD